MLIARPGLVPGRAVVTRVRYNDRGQPLTVSETGWVPTVDGLTAAGAVTLTLRYGYRLINNRSVLSEIDGPLPNGPGGGPADSDVTRIEYDARGDFAVRVTAPGDIGSEVLARDQALRPSQIRSVDGALTLLATVRNNRNGQPVSIGVQAGGQHRRTRYRYGADGYDALGRVTSIDGDAGAHTELHYDRGGNRTAELVRAPARMGETPAPLIRTYHYAQGSNRLLAIGTTGLQAAASRPASAWFYHATGTPLARFDWERDAGIPPTGRRTVYNLAKRPVAVYDNANQPIARYHYNLWGERIAKTLFPRQQPMRPAPSAVTGTRYYLYWNQRLAAETDEHGHIRAHYIYLDGKPVAKIDMAPNTTIWHHIRSALQGLFRRAAPAQADAGDSVARIHAIHTDQLGTPQLVTGPGGQIVWMASTSPFGRGRIHYAAPDATGASFELPLRLPGQMYDSETGLNYNYQRDYDPALGRYATPDPAGTTGGLNPYAYAGSNPLTSADPLGLYEEDIHYYMTYFLALTAGVDPKLAYIIATAAQYIDDNPDTRPLDPNYFKAAGDLITDNAAAQRRLAAYHFTQAESDDSSTDPATRFARPGNAQLFKLFNASIKAGELGGICAQAQMYGEYLHAFEDTFSHRDSDNAPLNVNAGAGHLLYGHYPDYTYNNDFRTLDTVTGQYSGVNWQYNEARTAKMEEEVFEHLKSTWGDAKNTSLEWEEVKKALDGNSTVEDEKNGFNGIRENSGNTHKFDGTITTQTKKITALCRFQWKLTSVTMSANPIF